MLTPRGSSFAVHTSTIVVYMRVRTHSHSRTSPPQRAAIRRARRHRAPRPLARTQLHCTPARCAACVKSAHKRRGEEVNTGLPRPAAFHQHSPCQTLARARRPHTQGVADSTTIARNNPERATNFVKCKCGHFHMSFPDTNILINNLIDVQALDYFL